MSDQEPNDKAATPEPNDDKQNVIDIDPVKTSIGFSATGKKIASRTTDLIAIAIVMIGTLIVAERLMKWWADDGSNDEANQQMAALRSLDPRWDINGTPVDIDLGELPYTLHREYVSGDEEYAVGAMSKICTQFVGKSSDIELPQGRILQSEETLLERLSTLKPIIENDRNWRLYRSPGLLPSVVVVQPQMELPENSEHDLSGWQVVAWAFAYPFGESNWLSFAFLKSGSDSVSLPELPSIELPRNTQRVLNVRARRAGSMMSFKSPLTANQWAQQMADILKSSGWQLMTYKNKPTLTRQFQSKTNGRHVRLDFQVEDDPDGQAYGMLNLMISR